MVWVDWKAEGICPAYMARGCYMTDCEWHHPPKKMIRSLWNDRLANEPAPPRRQPLHDPRPLPPPSRSPSPSSEVHTRADGATAGFGTLPVRADALPRPRSNLEWTNRVSQEGDSTFRPKELSHKLVASSTGAPLSQERSAYGRSGIKETNANLEPLGKANRLATSPEPASSARTIWRRDESHESNISHDQDVASAAKSSEGGSSSYWQKRRAQLAQKPTSEVDFQEPYDFRQSHAEARQIFPPEPPAAPPKVQHLPHLLVQTVTPARVKVKNRKMGATKRMSNGEAKPIGPHPSTIRVSAPYSTQSHLDKKLQPAAVDIHERSIAEAREDNVRLQGVAWLDNVRRALQLPIRTYTTACVYYHKFRLAHPSGPGGLDYDWTHAAAASLLTACKVEDTLKKSRDILAAAYNLRNPQHEPLGSDDSIFEQPSRLVIGLERLVLEASGFDFRSSQSHPIIVKLCRDLPESSLTDKVGRIAWTILTDLHRTLAPLKQTSATLAIASLELAAKLQESTASNDESVALVEAITNLPIKKWSVSREEVMETLLDSLELYTQHTNSTILGNKYSLDDFLRVRLALNKECTSSSLPRHTTAPSPSSAFRPEFSVANGHPTPVSPSDQSAQQQAQANGPTILPMPAVPEGGATLRFMLNPELVANEKADVQKHFIEEWEEYEEEIEIPLPRAPSKERDRELERRGPPPRPREFDERSSRSYDSPRPPPDVPPRSSRHEDRDRHRDRERDRRRDRSPAHREPRAPRDPDRDRVPPPAPAARDREPGRDRAIDRDRERERRYEDKRYHDRRYDDRGRGRYDERDRRHGGSGRYDDRRR